MIKRITIAIKAFFIATPIKGEKMENLGVLRIDRTVVSKQYLQTHPVWDNHLYQNIQVI